MTDAPQRLAAALSDRYHIERELGAGGMATVYLAEDLKHQRQVAIKVLKPELAAVLGAERFIQEITTTAQLQHPHILPLFDSGTADGFLFYVMPYIEGETLRDKLDRETQLGVEEAVRITREVADALDYAHRRGVIHRDIKPENILLHDGRPMVADFGIALAVSAAAGGRMTETGMSLGTPHYMSPEQATADKEITGRSDIYSLASVLYEMLTGDPPHVGSSAQQIIVKIIADEARPVGEVRKSVPSNVAAAVGKALEKLPADRFETAKAFADALADRGFRHGEAGGGVRHATGTTSRAWKVAALALALVTVALSAAVVATFKGAGTPAGVFRAVVTFPEGQSYTPQLGSSVALSADGSFLAFSGFSQTGPGRIWIRRGDAVEAVPVEGTDATWSPTISPDGRELAFIRPTGALEVRDLESGSTRTVADRAVLVLDWTPEGDIYFFRGTALVDVWRVSDNGGPAEQVPALSGVNGTARRWGPGHVLPDGENVVITRYPTGNPSFSVASVVVVDLSTGDVQEVAKGSDPTYLPPGYLIWGTADGALMAARFDAKAKRLTSQPVQVAQDVLSDVTGIMHYAVSNTGSLVYRTGQSAQGSAKIVWVSRDGSVAPATSLEVALTPGAWDIVDLSPDGSHVALSVAEGTISNVWTQRLGSSAPPSRITFDGSVNVRARWAPGGDSLTFITNKAGEGIPTQLWMVPANGAGVATPLVQADREVEEGFVSPDGEWIVYRLGGTSSNRDIYALHRGVDSVGRPLVATNANERAPQLSADGRWLAYASDETGRDEVFVTPFPEAGNGRWQVSTAGGSAPIWAHDGHELFFVAADGRMMDVEYSVSEASFRPLEIQPLFTLNGVVAGRNTSAYALSTDDKRFLMIADAEAWGQVVWVTNWIQELRALTDPVKAGR